nr:MAG TPA: hypothetical protein [Caudoviricetes sp.]
MCTESIQLSCSCFSLFIFAASRRSRSRESIRSRLRA